LSSLDQKLIALKLPEDKRSDEEFLTECKLHVDTKSDKANSYLKRANSLAKLLVKLKMRERYFLYQAQSCLLKINNEKKSFNPGRARTRQEWDSWKEGISGLEWVNAWRLKQQS